MGQHRSAWTSLGQHGSVWIRSVARGRCVRRVMTPAPQNTLASGHLLDVVLGLACHACRCKHAGKQPVLLATPRMGPRMGRLGVLWCSSVFYICAFELRLIDTSKTDTSTVERGIKLTLNLSALAPWLTGPMASVGWLAGWCWRASLRPS